MDYKLMKLAQKRQKVRIEVLCKQLGIHRERLGEILNGKSDPRVSELEAICEALGFVVSVSRPKANTVVEVRKDDIMRFVRLFAECGDIVLK